MSLKKYGRIDPKVKDILRLLAAGAMLSASIFIPGSVIVFATALKEYDKIQDSKQEKEWDKYNIWRLRQIIKRLEKEKVVKISGNKVIITERGKTKLLRYDLLEMRLKEKTDGKWRIIVYDIAELNKRQREIFRDMLKLLKFLQLQKSVYITPFPCEQEIEYLRQRFNIGSEVKVITSTGLENAEAYKKYFGL